MIHVEVVILDVRKDGPGERQLPVERVAFLLCQQRAVLPRDVVALRDYCVPGTENVLASFEACYVEPIIAIGSVGSSIHER